MNIFIPPIVQMNLKSCACQQYTCSMNKNINFKISLCLDSKSQNCIWNGFRHTTRHRANTTSHYSPSRCHKFDVRTSIYVGVLCYSTTACFAIESCFSAMVGCSKLWSRVVRSCVSQIVCCVRDVVLGRRLHVIVLKLRRIFQIVVARRRVLLQRGGLKVFNSALLIFWRCPNPGIKALKCMAYQYF